MSILKTLGVTYGILAATFFTLDLICRGVKTAKSLQYSLVRGEESASRASAD